MGNVALALLVLKTDLFSSAAVLHPLVSVYTKRLFLVKYRYYDNNNNNFKHPRDRVRGHNRATPNKTGWRAR